MQQICIKREFLEIFFIFKSPIEQYCFLFDEQTLCHNSSAKIMEC